MGFFTALAAVAAAAFTTTSLIQIGLAVGLQLLSGALRKKPKTDTGAIDAGQTLQPTLAFGVPRDAILGQRDVGGMEADRFSYGPNNEFLVASFVLSSRPCTGFVGLKVFGEPVTLSGDPTLGEVAVTSHFTGLGGGVRMWVRVFLGDNNAGYPAYINSFQAGRYNPQDVGGQMCIAVFRARHTNDDIDEDDARSHIPWQSGPPICRWEMQGIEVLDPRTGVTGYSDNPLLHDYAIDRGILDGVGANETVTIGNGYPVGLLDPDHVGDMATWAENVGYTSHGIVRSGEQGDQQEIWKTFNGQRMERPAQVITMPEGNRPHYGTVDLTDRPAAKVTEYDEHGESTEVLNRLHGFYVEPLEGYARKDLPSYSDPAWILADNHIPREDELGLHFVTDGDQALELIKQEAQITRHPARATLSNLWMSRAQIPSGVTIDLLGTDIPSINGRRWIVESVGTSALGKVSYSLREAVDQADLYLQTSDPTPNVPVPLPPRVWPWWGDIPALPTNFVSGIISGTQPVADINVTGIGSIIAKDSAQDANITSSQSGSGSLILSTSPSSATGSGLTGAITTAPITVNRQNASGAETISYAFVSGDNVFTVNNPNGFTTSFTANPAVSASAVYEATVVDGATTKTIQFNVFVLRTI